MYDAVPICRRVLNHWIYKDAEYLKVWLTMLARARWKIEPKTGLYEHTSYTINRGEFLFGRPSWCDKTGVSEQRMKRLIALLVTDNMIKVVRKTNKFTIYTIVNYDKFNQQNNQQGDQQNNQQQTEETHGIEGFENQQNNQQNDRKTPNKEERENKNVKNSLSPNLKFSEEQMNLAAFFRILLIERKPDIKIAASVEKWAYEIRLMVEQDKRTLERIREVMLWANADSFWQNNILSIAALRKNFDALELRMGNTIKRPDYSKVKK